MNMANNVYIESKFDLKPAFVDVAKNYFKASVDRFDRNKPMDAAMYANKWVDQSTNHLVPDMMASCKKKLLFLLSIFFLFFIFLNLCCRFHGWFQRNDAVELRILPGRLEVPIQQRIHQRTRFLPG